MANTGGSSNVTLGTVNLPSHSHTLSGTATATVTDPGHVHTIFMADGNSSGGGTFCDDAKSPMSDNITTDTNTTGITVSIGGATDSTGSGTAVNILNPYIALNFIIFAGI